MNKETLRMQMLAGVITESQYKQKLNEITTNDGGKEPINESLIGIAGTIIAAVLGLKTIGYLAKKTFGNLALKQMTNPYKLKELAEDIYNQSIEQDVDKGDMDLWYQEVVRLIDDGKIKNGLELVKGSITIETTEIQKIENPN